jgi:hypothetical protein
VVTLIYETYVRCGAKASPLKIRMDAMTTPIERFERWWPAWYEGKDAWPADLGDNPYPYRSIEWDAWRKGLLAERWSEERGAVIDG